MFTLRNFKIFQILLVVYEIMSICMLSSHAGAASTVPGLGKSFDEIVKLAIKEGSVHIASSLKANEVKLVLDPFFKKYPKIKVETTRITGIDEAEKYLLRFWGDMWLMTWSKLPLSCRADS